MSFRMFGNILDKADKVRFLGRFDGLKVYAAIRPVSGTDSTKFVRDDSPEAAFERAGEKTTAELIEMPAGTVFALSATQFEKIQFGRSKGQWYVYPTAGGDAVESATTEHAELIAQMVDAAEREDATIV